MKQVKITTKRPPAMSDLTWLRLASFLAICCVILASVKLLGEDITIKEVAVTGLTAIIPWFIGKVAASSPLQTVNQHALRSMPPARAEAVITTSLQGMDPEIVDQIVQRANSLRPAANTGAETDGIEEKEA